MVENMQQCATSITSVVSTRPPSWPRSRFSPSEVDASSPPGPGLLGVNRLSSLPRASDPEGVDPSRGRREQSGARSSIDPSSAVAFLSEASVLLASTLDYRQTLENAVRVPLSFLADRCAIYMLDEHQRLQKIAVACVDDSVALRTQELERWYTLEESFGWGPCRVAQTGVAELVQVDDRLLAGWARDEAHLQLLRAVVPSSCLFVPLTVRGQILGALTCGMSESGRRYALEDLAVGEDLARRIAMAIDNARRYHELELADRSKSDFLSTLATELRNPLGPIRNATELLRRLGARDLLQSRALDTIERQIGLQATMLEDLLNVIRISRGQIQIEQRTVDLVGLARQTAEDHRAAMMAAGLRLELEIPASPVMVRGDSRRLTQMLGNLLSNASRFTDPGGQVTLTLVADPGAGTASIRVLDTGIGIDSALLARVFEPFARGDRGTERSRGGLGLGLALVQGVMALHGGQARAWSEGIGRGCELTVTLPLDRPATQPSCETPPPVRSETGPRPRRILIIEDNPDAAESLQMLLDLYGYQVQVEHSATTGLAAARVFSPELILCDIGLPGMSGYELAARLKSAPETSSIHLVAMTGYGQEEDRLMASEAGFDLHLTKPVDPDELFQYLGELKALEDRS